MRELFVKSGENNPAPAKYMLGLYSPAGLRQKVLSVLIYFGQICEAGVLIWHEGVCDKSHLCKLYSL